MHALSDWLLETWKMNEAMAPWLLFGFALSGLLHAFLPTSWIRKHLAHEGAGSVFKAALAGIPLPFCSCGVIPISSWLRREGASKGATMSFLVSTPTSGLDSILATLAMMGPVFAVARPVVAMVSGVTVGLLVSRIQSAHIPQQHVAASSCADGCDVEVREGEVPSAIRVHAHTLVGRLREAVEYGFVELVEDLSKWLVLGLFIGGAISAFVPANLFAHAGTMGWVGSYVAVLLLSIPLYTCATGSIPIAAALVAKGVSPGAALVFLILGPATNMATIAFVGGTMGKKILAVFLVTVTAIALAAGVVIDIFAPKISMGAMIHQHGSEQFGWFTVLAAIVLAVLLLPPALRKIRDSLPLHTSSHHQGASMVLTIPSISCGNCVRHIDKAAHTIPGVESVQIDIATKRVEISGTFDQSALVAVLNKEGYPPA